jgi:Putative transposase
VGITLTMPHVLWPVFKAHRRLQHDLPALGAAVLTQWAWNRFQARLFVMVIPHTFGGRLNYHPHLHMMVSAGGLRPTEGDWLKSLAFDEDEIMALWRFAVASYLWRALRNGLLEESSVPRRFDRLLMEQSQRKWNIHISQCMSKKRFLGYAGRYIRRLPIGQKRILRVSEEEIVFLGKIKRLGPQVEYRCTLTEFVGMLSEHVQDRYQHSMRYYGLLAPRTKKLTSAALFALLGQNQLPKPPRERWAASLKKHFGIDPLLDEFGDRMRWVGRRKPSTLREVGKS